MIVIIGAGIAGLSLGYELIKLGIKVTILEKAKIASGASGVATSYLEPRLGNTAMRAIESESMRRWEDYANELESRSGLKIGFNRDGQIKVTLRENIRHFKKDLAARVRQEALFEQLSSKSLQALEPSLSGDIIDAIYLPEVRWVTGHMVCKALAEIIENSYGQIIEGCEVTGIESSPSGLGIKTSRDETFNAEKLILCTGFGASLIKDLPDDVPQSRAVRGVNLVLDQSGLTHPLTHLIKHHRGNMCPRENSQLIVGTTYESDQTSLQVDEDVVEFLYSNAEPILPSVRQMPLLKVTAGLRSKVGDGNLRLGQSKAQPGLYYSLSHGGAGYLRAPVIASELARFVLDNEPGELTKHHTSQ
ncbi:MAG: NAD(P)/FAD-dependent oxidoreductase [Rhizobiaceae bacterium]